MATFLSQVGTLVAPATPVTQKYLLDPEIWGTESPLGIFAWWTGQTTQGIASDYGMGFGVGNVQNTTFDQFSSSQDDVPTSVARRRNRARLLTVSDFAGTIIEECDLEPTTPFEPAAFNLSWGTVDGSSTKVYQFVAFGGSGLQIDTRTYSSPPTAGEVTYNDPGFRPDLLIAITSGDNTFNDRRFSVPSIGFSDGRNQVMLWNASEDDRPTSDCARLLSRTNFVGLSVGNAIDGPFTLGSVVRHEPLGFTLDWLPVSDGVARLFQVAAIKGIDARIVFDTQSTFKRTKSTPMGLPAQLVLLLTAMALPSTDVERDAGFGIGAVDLAGNQGYSGAFDKHGLPTTESSSILDPAALAMIDPVLRARAVATLRGQSLDLSYDIADNVEREFAAVCIAEQSRAGHESRAPDDRPHSRAPAGRPHSRVPKE